MSNKSIVIPKDTPKEKESSVQRRLVDRLLQFGKNHSIKISVDNPPSSFMGRAGRPDLTVWMGAGSTFMIEVKTTKGKLSGLQKIWAENQNEKHPAAPVIVLYGTNGIASLLELMETHLAEKNWKGFIRALQTLEYVVK